MKQFDGIVLKKTVVKEQDLVVSVLTENGVKLDLYVYGGKSSKKRQSSILEYGHVLSFKLKSDQKIKSGIQTLTDYNLKWSSSTIRENYHAFYLMSFYLEIILNISTETEDMEHEEHREFYNLLANSLFYLDKYGKKLDTYQHLFLFLTKVIYYMGIMPDLERCIVSDQLLAEFPSIELDFQNSGFVGTHQTSRKDKELLKKLEQAYSTKFQDVLALENINQIYCQKIFQYFITSIGFDKNNFKLYSTLLG